MKMKMLAWMSGLVTMLLLIGATAGPAVAADVELVPSITLRGEYDDNINFQKNNETDDYITTISPALTYKYNTDQLKLSTRAGMDVRRYVDESDLDDEKYALNLNAAYQAMERLGLTADFGYIKDTTLDSFLEETGRVFAREDHQQYTAGGGLSFNLTERLNTGVNYRYRLSDFDSSISEDFTTHTVSGFLGFKLKNQIDSLYLTPMYGRTDLDTKDIDTYSINLAWERKFTEMYSIRTSVGQRFTRQKFDGVDDDEKSNGWIADVNLTRIGEISTIVVGFGRDLAVGTQGELQEVNRIYGRLSYKLLERLTAQMAGSLIFSSQEGDRGIDNDTTYYTIAPSLSYQFTEYFLMSAGYSYGYSEDDLIEEDSATRNVAWLNLTFQFGRKW